MNTADARRYAASMEIPLTTPSMMRPKSWLLLMQDPEGGLHFYDCKDSPAAALRRLEIAAGTKCNELLEIIPHTSPEGALQQAKTLREALAMVDYLKRKVTRGKPDGYTTSCAHVSLPASLPVPQSASQPT